MSKLTCKSCTQPLLHNIFFQLKMLTFLYDEDKLKFFLGILSVFNSKTQIEGSIIYLLLVS